MTSLELESQAIIAINSNSNLQTNIIALAILAFAAAVRENPLRVKELNDPYP